MGISWFAFIKTEQKAKILREIAVGRALNR